MNGQVPITSLRLKMSVNCSTFVRNSSLSFSSNTESLRLSFIRSISMSVIFLLMSSLSNHLSSPYEALVINDASKIGAIESPSDLKPQQDTITTDQAPCLTPEPHTKKDQILMGLGKEINLQDMDQWSVFMENLRYTPAPGFNIQGQGCLDFSPE